jgi:hypothetical protein
VGWVLGKVLGWVGTGVGRYWGGSVLGWVLGQVVGWVGTG